MTRPLKIVSALLALGVAATVLAGCGSDGGGGSGAGSRTVVVATHDSWAMPKSVLADFTRRTGYRVKIEQQGDAGELTNKLVLTKGSPIADATYGIDNTFATRASDEGVLADHTARLPAGAQGFVLAGKAGAQLTPVDFGDVCVNVDDAWFAAHHLAEPRTLDDLTKPAYQGLFVTPGATTSSPGLAFLAATIAAKGTGWQDYWKALLANGTKVVPGWTEAYEGDFTAGGGKGTRPIVVSYSSSPPFTIPKGATRPTTSALLDTCFRQVEYAGVLAGASNPAGAKAFVDFMVSREVQRALPDSMYVYPVDRSVPLPAGWDRWAKVAPKPWTVPAAELSKDRAEWLRAWRDLVSG
jgi:thiamine transport system substrate-binding protein